MYYKKKKKNRKTSRCCRNVTNFLWVYDKTKIFKQCDSSNYIGYVVLFGFALQVVFIIYPDMISPHCFKNARGGFIILVNFLGQVHKPFWKAKYL